MIPPAPDYSLDACWLSQGIGTKAGFDIFYLYPTFYQGPAGALMDIYSTPLKPHIKYNISKNCGIFAPGGNIWAPLYRQASFRSITMTEAEKAQILTHSLADVSAAFDYFIKNFNKGRPFVLAGHSQGSRLLRELMKSRFNDAKLSGKLIAAYLIGAEVTEGDLKTCPWLKLALSAGDGGVIITYNTQAAGVKNSPIYERGGAVCVNPLNWGPLPADKALNKGAVFFDKKGSPAIEIPAFTSARIEPETGALIASDVDIDKYSFPAFPKGVFHLYDYEFFYRNLQENFRVRLKSMGL